MYKHVYEFKSEIKGESFIYSGNLLIHYNGYLKTGKTEKHMKNVWNLKNA